MKRQLEIVPKRFTLGASVTWLGKEKIRRFGVIECESSVKRGFYYCRRESGPLCLVNFALLQNMKDITSDKIA